MRKEWILALLLIMALALGACAQPVPAPPPEEEEAPPEEEAAEAPSEIHVFNWSDYVAPGVYEMFEEETGIKVIEDNFSSNEEMVAKLEGGAEYDVIFPSDYTVALLIEAGMLAEPNFDNIPNLENIGDEWFEVGYDPGLKYCVPYLWGTTGLGYNPEEVDEPTSWAAIFDPGQAAAYEGRITLLDDSREAFAAALIYLGYDINTTDEAQLAEARDLLTQIKPEVMAFDSDTYEELLGSGESLVAHGWSGDFLLAMEDYPDTIAYTVPEEGGVLWVDNMCIPANAPNKEAAEKFVNFFLDPEVGQMNAEYAYYPTPNEATEELLDEEFLSDPSVYPPEEVRAKLQSILPVGDAQSIYERMFDEVKAAG